MAHEYFLYTRTDGSSNWNYTGYQLKLSGNSNNNLQVHYRAYDKSNPPSGGWNTLTGASRSGNGSPDSPQDGDDLDLPSSVGPVTDLTGDAGYDSTGSDNMGAGYYPGEGPQEEEGDWCATSN